MMFRANFAWIVTEDESVLDLARVGIRNTLSRVSKEPRPTGRASRPRKH